MVNKDAIAALGQGAARYEAAMTNMYRKWETFLHKAETSHCKAQKLKVFEKNGKSETVLNEYLLNVPNKLVIFVLTNYSWLNDTGSVFLLRFYISSIPKYQRYSRCTQLHCLFIIRHWTISAANKTQLPKTGTSKKFRFLRDATNFLWDENKFLDFNLQKDL